MRWFSNERGESVWKMYFSFHGRIDRLTLWLRIILLNVFTYIVLVTMNSLSTEYTGINYGSWLNCVLVVYWWSLTTLWVRRVHDRGHGRGLDPRSRLSLAIETLKPKREAAGLEKCVLQRPIAREQSRPVFVPQVRSRIGPPRAANLTPRATFQGPMP